MCHPSSTGINGRNLAVKEDVLNANKGHYFHLTVQSHRHSKPGNATMFLKPNEPPVGGTCNLTVVTSPVITESTSKVTALIDRILITCSGWRDLDDPMESPLTYSMYVQRGGIGILTGDWYPLYRGTQGYGYFYLSQWAEETNIYVHVDVIDRMGATAEGFKRLVVFFCYWQQSVLQVVVFVGCQPLVTGSIPTLGQTRRT